MRVQYYLLRSSWSLDLSRKWIIQMVRPWPHWEINTTQYIAAQILYVTQWETIFTCHNCTFKIPLFKWNESYYEHILLHSSCRHSRKYSPVKVSSYVQVRALHLISKREQKTTRVSFLLSIWNLTCESKRHVCILWISPLKLREAHFSWWLLGRSNRWGRILRERILTDFNLQWIRLINTDRRTRYIKTSTFYTVCSLNIHFHPCAVMLIHGFVSCRLWWILNHY